MEAIRPESRRYTLEEYFEIERNSSERYEYRDGQVVNLHEIIGMSGGAVPHSRIAMNFGIAMGNRLKGSSCAVYSSDLRIRIPRKTLWAHPDATVICGKPRIESIPGVGDTATNPQIIIEVLSPSTEAYDRGDKFARYREIETLREYVLVSQNEARVEVFHRSEDGQWSFGPFAGLDCAASLASLNLENPLAEIYDGIEFPASE
jgi:Uma2 family endonuclease